MAQPNRPTSPAPAASRAFARAACLCRTTATSRRSRARTCRSASATDGGRRHRPGRACSASASSIIWSCAPGAKAMITSAGRNGSSSITIMAKQRRRGDGDRERSDRGAEIVDHRAPAGVGEARARDRAEHDHRAAAEPPRQDRMHPAGAVQDRGARHRAEQQTAGKFDPAQEQRQRRRHDDQNRKLGQRRAARRLRRAEHRSAREPEQRERCRAARS